MGLIKPTDRSLITLAAFLVVYENVVAVITGGELFFSVPAALAIAAILIAVMIGWSRRSNLTLVELGITRYRAGRGAAIGLAVAAVVAALAVVTLRSGLLVPGPVEYSPFASMTVADALLRALVWVPLATVVPEELAFRGVLLALLRRRYRDAQVAVLSAIPFALWHALIIVHTVGRTSLARTPLSLAIGILGGFAAVAVGGWLFAQLRIRSGSLITSMVCHWAFNGSILIGLYALQR